MQLMVNVEKPTAQLYFEKDRQMERQIYTLARRVTINTNLRMFQYKLLHNSLYLNEMFYKFGKKVSSISSFLMEKR